MPRRATAPLAALALVVALSMSSCAADDDSTPTEATTTSSSPPATPSNEPDDPGSESPDDAGTAVTVTRQAGKFTPNGERVDLDVGETLSLTITADAAGELHVHSTPEQTIAYDAGTSEHEITIDRPGLVEVENHEPAVVVLQLEVR